MFNNESAGTIKDAKSLQSNFTLQNYYLASIHANFSAQHFLSAKRLKSTPCSRKVPQHLQTTPHFIMARLPSPSGEGSGVRPGVGVRPYFPSMMLITALTSEMSTMPSPVTSRALLISD